MARIVVIASFTRSLTVFRGDLLRDLVAAGHEVIACSPAPDADSLRELGEIPVVHVAYHLQRTGQNPVADWQSFCELRSILRRLEPDLVLSYTIKPVIYGSLAARSAGVPGVHAIITGLGTTFEKPGAAGRVLNLVARLLYRRALAKANTVFFQNPDDRDIFLNLNLVRQRQTVMIAGSGINTDRFVPSRLPAGPVCFLLIARLLREKGVREFAAAARLLRRQGLPCRCRIVGFFDDHPQAISRDEMDAWVSEGLVEFVGSLQDVRPALADCTVYCLPSYREGLPRTVLEAMAAGRAIITTEAPGCRETVTPDQNGFLVPPRDPEALAAAMARYIADPSLAERHGARSRAMAVASFDVRQVNRTIIETIIPD